MTPAAARAATVAGSVDPAVDIAGTPRRPPPVDYAIAGLMAIWAVVEGVLGNAAGPWQGALFGLGFALPLVVRRRHAVAGLAWVGALAIVRAAIEPGSEGAMPFPVMLILTFSAGLHIASPRTTAAALVIALATLPIVSLLGDIGGSEDPVAYVILPFFVGCAFAAGRVIRRRAQQVLAEQERGGERAREAVLEERARIARELHDVVAHSMSIVTVQAGAAEAVVEHDPALAREHLAAVRRTAHEALVEMRRLTGVLREHDASVEPQPGLARLDELVEDSALPVTVEVEGDPDGLPAGVDLAAFRIVQEALTNVRKHAGAVPTAVRLIYDPATVTIAVENAPGAAQGAPGSGRGLPGMRERARVYGGSVTAGPRAGGGFAVRAVLPREGLPE
jgi:signal transduction histidine kinase